jgi:GTP-binding protein EngB required for normal cell division
MRNSETYAMKILSAEFVTSAAKPSEYPPEGYPEIAFAGRSNVGKSSLINVLVNRSLTLMIILHLSICPVTDTPEFRHLLKTNGVR